MFVNLTASWSGTFTKLGSQALKGITDNIKHYRGSAIDIHKQIGKLPKPTGGWTLPGHRYTGLYNNLENQVKWDPETSKILQIYEYMLVISESSTLVPLATVVVLYFNIWS